MTQVLWLSRRDVEAVLTVSQCIDVVEAALGRLAMGRGQQPVRTSLQATSGVGVLALMPAELTDPAVLGFKAVTVFPGNRTHALPSHQALVSLVDPDTGRPIAVMDGTAITAIRTAAVSAVATKHLARVDAASMAILGAGVQARAHLAAIPLVRDIERVWIWSRRASEAERLASEVRAGSSFDVTVAPDAGSAARQADIIVTATSSREPVLEAGAVAPGSHINAVGACFADTRELSGPVVAEASVFVDDLAAAWIEAGDLILARNDGLIDGEHVRGELGADITGRTRGRPNDSAITIFESLGLGVEDIAVGAHVVEQASAREIGTVVEL